MLAVYVALAALIGVTSALARRARRGLWILLPLAALYLIIPGRHGFERFRDKYDRMRQDGVLFASRAWDESQSVEWAGTRPQAGRLYSNQALILQFLTSRPVYSIPEVADVVKAEPRADFEEQLQVMRADLEEPGSFLLVFDPARPMTPEEFPDVFEQGLQVVRVLPDGFIMSSVAAGSAP
jgi:hypothetical protein